MPKKNTYGISVKLNRNSSFVNETHFFYCLTDLINEWEDIIGPKEMDKLDSGFNCERLTELKTMLNKRRKSWTINPD